MTVLPSEASNNITGMYTYMQWVQEASDGYFIPMIMFGLFVVLFVISKSFGSSGKAFVGSSFIVMIMSIIFTTQGFMASQYMYITIILTAVGTIWAFLENKFE